MSSKPITVPSDMTVGELCDLLQEKNINGAPVIDRSGRLVGVVTQEDIIYGAMGHTEDVPGTAGTGGAAPPGRRGAARSPRRERRLVGMLRDRRLQPVPAAEAAPGEKPFWADLGITRSPMEMPVSAIMTSPAISAEEETPLADLCRIMWNLRIHRVPIVRKGRVTGLVSSMDLCRAILAGTIRV